MGQWDEGSLVYEGLCRISGRFWKVGCFGFIFMFFFSKLIFFLIREVCKQVLYVATTNDSQGLGELLDLYGVVVPVFLVDGQ